MRDVIVETVSGPINIASSGSVDDENFDAWMAELDTNNGSILSAARVITGPAGALASFAATDSEIWITGPLTASLVLGNVNLSPYGNGNILVARLNRTDWSVIGAASFGTASTQSIVASSSYAGRVAYIPSLNKLFISAIAPDVNFNTVETWKTSADAAFSLNLTWSAQDQ